ncbi:hypothetical protein [Anaerovibrio lipolyticus]|uniref:hypothetical protein n=1 Tax=Anaerovibrio lipolyticus TaxID=82374 RepID=UPI00048669FD|nr:hypothetical protein [Anaerovibrio lipolyticus]
MNKNAENFKKYLEEKDIKIFQVEEIEGDERETVVFRSNISVEGQQLPTAVIIDNSVFATIRVQISPKAVTEENQLDLLKLINGENLQYKPFKFYFDDNGTLLMDICLVVPDDDLKGETVYLMFEVIINYLNNSYRNLMKTIWK